jgi:hypothetical protein
VEAWIRFQIQGKSLDPVPYSGKAGSDSVKAWIRFQIQEKAGSGYDMD